MYRITDDETFNRLIGSVRCRSLQKLLLVWYNIFYDMENSPIAKAVYERIRAENPKAAFTLENILMNLRAGDIVGFLNTSERTAKEYIYALRAILLGTQRRKP